MKVQCPKCHAEIPSDDINVAKDTALCRACGEAFALSEEVSPDELADSDLNVPPKGVTVFPTARGFSISSVAHSSQTIKYIFSALFWNGILSVFLVSFCSSVLKNGWSVSLPGKNGGVGPPAIRTLLLLVPFLAIGLILAAAAVVSLFGRIEIILDGRAGTVFTGLGPIGWRRRFDWSKVHSISDNWTYFMQGGRSVPMVVLNGEKTIKFGQLLSEERRDYIIAVLRRYLADRGRV